MRRTNEKPMLFSGPMVRAILDGRKTQTRRVVKLPLHCRNTGCELTPGELTEREISSMDTLCPYGGPKTRLWVRETWRVNGGMEYEYQQSQPSVIYKSTVETQGPSYGLYELWRPSIFMPRWASRITLEITAIRIERLQTISELDCLAEGVSIGPVMPEQRRRFAVKAFQDIWDSINAKRGFEWETNPLVWVITFKKL